VAETVQALEGLIDASSINGEIFNVGSMERVSILELASRILEAAESSSELEFISYDVVYGRGIEDMLHRIPAIEKIRRATSWKT
jgi:nucleoside-diphosphate-sugar epimerase